LQTLFSKFKKDWNGQSTDKKKKNSDNVRDELKRVLTEFNVSAKKYYASQFLSLGSSSTTLPEGLKKN
jgi:gamma-glutamyl:cysteine ligase YbdK (ATP-grasp superfamily)